MNGSVSYLVNRLRSLIRDEIQAELDARGVTGVDASYAEVFAAIANGKDVTITAIAEDCRRTKSTISFLVDKLLKAGFVQKSRASRDGRAVSIVLTDKGQELHAVFEAITEKINARLTAEMKKKEKKKLLKLLALAESTLQSQGSSNPAE